MRIPASGAVLLIAQPFGDVDGDVESNSPAGLSGIDKRCVLEAAGPDTGDEQLAFADHIGPLRARREDANGSSRRPSRNPAGVKFIGGEPMNPATNRCIGCS